MKVIKSSTALLQLAYLLCSETSTDCLNFSPHSNQSQMIVILMLFQALLLHLVNRCKSSLHLPLLPLADGDCYQASLEVTFSSCLMQFPASLARLSLMVADTSGTNLFWFFTRGHLVLFLVILKFSSAFFQWFWRWLLFHNHKVEHFPLQQYLAVSKFLLLLFQHLLGSSTEL